MHHYMPQIFYHDRKALLSVDVHPVSKDGHYKIVTASTQHEIRIWDFFFEAAKGGVHPIVINFIANLEGHNGAINQVKFCQNSECNLLASGDVLGRISIWQLSSLPCTVTPLDDFPPNKENWQRIKVLNHDSDVTAMCWSPCGKYIASVSNDDSLQVCEALTGKRQFIVSYLRHFPNGVSYDPLGKYIITMSTDRKMDLLCAHKGTRLRNFGVCELPQANLGEHSIDSKVYKLFHDDQLTTFTRYCAFSPCGQIIVAPAGRLEIGSKDLYCTYIFKRWELEKDRPAIILPTPLPTFCIKFCPIIFKLDENYEQNMSGLPYRLIWLALTRVSIIFYDSQHPHAIALVENISYNYISDASWSSDGKNVVISSMEGYCHYLKFNVDSLGVTVEKLPECPESPHFVKRKAKKDKKKTEKAVEEKSPKTPTPVTPTSKISTPKTGAHTPKTGTPKSAIHGGLMLRYLKEGDGSPASSKVQPSNEEEEASESKSVKRIDLVTIE